MTESANNKFTCACEEEHRSACQSQPFFKGYNGQDYCVLHWPFTDKIERFRTALKNKLDGEDFDFRGVSFPEAADFSEASFSVVANFSGAFFTSDAIFSRAIFSASANFSFAHFTADADFEGAHFIANANFTGASFYGVGNFSSTSFRVAADFNLAHFSATANFYRTSFSAAADFNGAIFSAVAYFAGVCFKDYARFSGTENWNAFGEKSCLDLQFAQIEKPERVSFHTLILRPHWFINVDSRKFEVVYVDWDYRLKEELQGARENGVRAPHRLLAIACRQLADNAEANHRYHEASRFRFNAFEARRIETYRGFVPWRLDWWYWLASGYGESVGRAFLVFVTLLVLFTLGYKYSEFVPSAPTAAPPATVAANAAPPTAPDLPPKRLGWREAALYSFNVSILQKPEPKPKGLWASFLVSLETVLGPAQAALLALAVRRRFMR